MFGNAFLYFILTLKLIQERLLAPGRKKVEGRKMLGRKRPVLGRGRVQRRMAKTKRNKRKSIPSSKSKNLTGGLSKTIITLNFGDKNK